ncbi:MAG: hypothetical protein ABEN55_04110 [Bradymonadaceae bacterium]
MIDTISNLLNSGSSVAIWATVAYVAKRLFDAYQIIESDRAARKREQRIDRIIDEVSGDLEDGQVTDEVLEYASKRAKQLDIYSYLFAPFDSPPAAEIIERRAQARGGQDE